jgi:diguanylate cyclase (GGDEF)-like protein
MNGDVGTGRKPANILIVDDTPANLHVLTRMVEELGYIARPVTGGKMALQAAQSHPPDLVLLDIIMPGMDGYEVCTRLKADEKLQDVPVIFISALHETADKVKGLELGAVDFVTKPFDAFELRARVSAALRTKRMQDLLIEHAKIDPLTGLTNRRGLMERLQQEWDRVQRHGGALSFIMGDVDHFKRINDTHGHAVGDQALCEVADAIVGRCRKTDLPSRYGGEEFAIVVPDEAVSAAARLAERCRQAVEAVRLSTRSESLRITASFGVADSTGVASPEALVQQADKALYRAKNAGRNRVEVRQND